MPGVELRFHDIHLYNAVYRFDDQMLVTPYLRGAHGFQHPLFHGGDEWAHTLHQGPALDSVPAPA